MSAAGQELLVKVVAHAIMLYTMNCFLLSKYFAMSSTKWLPNFSGIAVNILNPSSLVAQVFRARYFPNSPFVEAQVCNNASYYWRSICAARHNIELGSRWQIGSRETTKIWEDF